MATRRLSLVLDLDTGGYSGKLTQAGTQLRTFNGQVDQTSNSVRNFGDTFNRMGSSLSTPVQKLRDYVLILGTLRSALSSVRELAFGWAESMIDQSSKMERLTVLMKGLSNATTDMGKNQEAQKNLQGLLNMARQTGFELNTLTDAFVKFKSGKLNPNDGSLKALADAVASFGGNSQTMERAALAIQQMAGKGVISMEELRRQLGEAVPSAITIMARAMDTTVADLTKKISTGAVQAGPALQKMFAEMERTYHGAGQKMADTMSGQLAQVRTNFTELATEFTGLGEKQGLFKGLEDGLKQLNTLMRSDEAKQFMLSLGQGAASVASMLISLIQDVVRFKDQIIFAVEAIATIWGARTLLSGFNIVRQGLADISAAVRGFIAGGAGINERTLAQIQLNSAVATGNAVLLDSAKAEAGRASAAADAAVQMEREAALTARRAAAEAAMAEQTLIQLRAQQLARQNLVATQEAEQLAALNQLQTGRNEAGQFASRDAALAQYTRSTERLRIARGMLATTDTEVAAAETAYTEATARATVAQEAATVATTAATAAVAREEAAIAADTMVKSIWTAVTAAGTVAVEGFGVAVNLALGPIGIIAMLLIQAANAAGIFESAADKATAAAERMRQGFARAGDAASVAAQKAQLAAEIKDLQDPNKKFAVLGRTGENAVASDADRQKAIKAKEDQLAALNDAEVKNAQADNARRQRQWYDQINGDHSRFLDNLSANYNRQLNIIDKSTADEKVRLTKRQQLRAQYDAAAKGDMAKRVAQLESYRDAMQRAGKTSEVNSVNAALRQLRGDAEEAAGALDGGGTTKGGGKGYSTAIANAMGQTAKLRAELAGSAGNLAKFNAELAAGAPKYANWSAEQIAAMRGQMAMQDALSASRKGANTNKSFDERLAATAGKIAQLRDELDGGQGDLAKFEAQLAAGAFKGVSKDRIDEMREYLKILEGIEHTKKVDSATKGLTDELAKAKTEADSYWTSFNAGTMEADQKLSQLKARFADKLLGLTGQDLENAQQKINQIVDTMQRAEAAQTTQGWKDQAREISESLLAEDQQREANFQRELDRQQKLLDAIRKNASLTVQEREAAERNFADWKRANEMRLQRENESATTKMARDWANLGHNMQQALAGALNSFVDAMFNANASFGDFAKELIKSILKVILEALIAYAILSAIGMANNSSGQHVSLGDFMKGQMSAGFGGGSNPASMIGFSSQGAGVSVPTHHTGGVVGTRNAMATVSASLFAGAPRYHGGGWIGGPSLKPGEVPMIGLKDEVVLTKDQQSVIGGALQGNSQPPNVQVNVINNSQTQLDAQQGKPEMNGRDMIVTVVVDELTKEGMLRNAVKGVAKNG